MSQQSTNPQIPNQAMPVVTQGGKASQPWFTFFQNLAAFANNISTGVLSFNGRAGAVDLTESDVTGALGFTPGKGNGTVTTSNPLPTLGMTAVFTGNTQIDPNNAFPAGFGFFAGGTMTAAELLGTAVWGTPRLFKGTIFDVAQALFAPTNPATLTLWSYGPGNTRFEAGTISFPGGSTVGALSWLAPLALAPGAALEVNAPATPDPTLASVRVQAYAS